MRVSWLLLTGAVVAGCAAAYPMSSITSRIEGDGYRSLTVGDVPALEPGELPRVGEVLGADHPFWARIAPRYRKEMAWTYLFTPAYPDEPARMRQRRFQVFDVADGLVYWGDGAVPNSRPAPAAGPFILRGPDAYTFVGAEAVTVPAGTFPPALKFRAGDTFSWFVPGVGKVREVRTFQDDGRDVEATLNLLSFFDGEARRLPVPTPPPTPLPEGAAIPFAFGVALPAPLCLPVLPNGAVVTTLAGDGRPAFTDGPGREAHFRMPYDLDVDRRTGVVYVADQVDVRIRAVLPSGEVRTVAGNGLKGWVDGPGVHARFEGPNGLCVAPDGTLYVADTYGHRIRRIDPQGNVTTFAGSGTAGAVDGRGTGASFDAPHDVAIDAQGNLYVSEGAIGRIRKVAPDGTTTTLAVGIEDAREGGFNSPMSIAVDGAGVVYFASASDAVHRLGADGRVEALARGLFTPHGLAFDGRGGLLVS